MRLGAALFDFDGTLADTFELAVRVVNELGPKYRLIPITREQFRGQNSAESLRAIGLSRWRLPFFVREARGVMRAGMDEISLFPGVADVLRDLSSRGVRLGIVSSNSEENVRGVLARSGVEGLFESVVTGSSLFGKHRPLRALVRQMRVDLGACVYVGDETRDVLAARRLGMPVIPVSWGYHSGELLREFDPVATVGDLRARLLGRV